MATIQCSGCKAHLSITGSLACPRCQTPLPASKKLAEKSQSSRRPGSLTSSVESELASGAPLTKQPAPASTAAKDIFAYTVLGAIVVCIVLIAYRVIVPSDETVHARKVSAALLACQQRIAGLAEFGGADQPPYAKNYGKGNEFYFAWSRGTFHFTNAFGARVAMSASCVGDVDSGQIKHMTLNGKDVI